MPMYPAPDGGEGMRRMFCPGRCARCVRPLRRCPALQRMTRMRRGRAAVRHVNYLCVGDVQGGVRVAGSVGAGAAKSVSDAIPRRVLHQS